jgi:multidrug efflux pump subunit AcrB
VDVDPSRLAAYGWTRRVRRAIVVTNARSAFGSVTGTRHWSGSGQLKTADEVRRVVISTSGSRAVTVSVWRVSPTPSQRPISRISRAVRASGHDCLAKRKGTNAIVSRTGSRRNQYAEGSVPPTCT